MFLPDIGMLMAALGTWLLCRSQEKKRPVEEMVQYNQDFDAEEQVRLTIIITYSTYIKHYSHKRDDPLLVNSHFTLHIRRSHPD